MKRLIYAAVASAALGVIGGTHAATTQGVLNPQETRTVTERVQKIRALKFERAVPFSYLTVDEAQRRLRADIARESTPAEFKVNAREGQMVGLYPSGIDLARDNVTAIKSALAGFYDSTRKDLVIIERPVPANLPINPRLIEFALKLRTAGVLAHELTHALQDQHYDLSARLKASGTNSDRERAFRALVEGDATLAGFCTVGGRSDDETIDYFLSNNEDVSAIFLGSAEGVAVQMREMFIFPYRDGARFVADAYHRHGWKSVDAIYRNPPQSTQQILHPELYFEHPAAPVEVRVGGYEKVLPAWKKVDENTYGELVLKLIIERWMGEQTPYVEAAKGWAGDRLVTLQNREKLTVLWIVAFHDSGQAENFADLYPQILAKALPGLTARRVEQQGSAVLVLIGDGAIRFHELAPAVWNGSTIGGARAESSTTD
jgi:hypothetical protein